MSDPTSEFFNQIGQRRHVELAAKFHGTIRFDLRCDHRTEHWYLRLGDESVQVSREASAADAVVHTDEELFDQMVSGRRNVKAALLRGALTVEGDIALLTAFQDLLPGPPGATDPGVRARARRLDRAADLADATGDAGRPGDANRRGEETS